MPEQFADIALNIAVEQAFTYRVPEHLQGQVIPGRRVEVPFRNRRAAGYCVALSEKTDLKRTLDITALLDDAPLISENMLKLTKWISEYYCSSWGQALDAALPGGVRKDIRQRTEIVAGLTVGIDDARAKINDLEKRSPKQAHVIETLLSLDYEPSLTELCRLADCGPGPANGLKEKGIIKYTRRVVTDDPLLTMSVAKEKPLRLEPAQKQALDHILSLRKRKSSGVLLLHGVTGSGKTEVYLQAIEQAVAEGKSAIVLVPEISLTPQTVRRFKARFDRVAVLHSHLTESQRNEQWQEIRSGKTQVVVGARSAIFAPLPNLGLIVVDEESDTSFKQDSVPRYNARDVAMMRGHFEGAVVVLGSATPALESWYNAKIDKYELASLPGRVERRPLPKVELIDMKKEMAAMRQFRFLSRHLVALIEERLAKDEQIILFLNRRGFSTFITCNRCGWALKCKHCDISMTYHKKLNRAVCHYCGLRSPVPTACPDCHDRESLRYFGLGTEKVEDEIKTLFPGVECARMDSDTVRGRGAHVRVLDAFRDGRVKILIGTKMIAKGLDFPNVTLVGVVNADTSLHLPDFRSCERTHMLVSQVAGRTGRGPKGGLVVIQTSEPEHYTMRTAAAHDFIAFAEHELEHRKALNLPPFGRAARIIIEGRSESSVRSVAGDIGKLLDEAAKKISAVVLGPSPCPIEKVKDRFRWHILILAGKSRTIRDMISSAKPALSGTNSVHVAVDVDPLAML